MAGRLRRKLATFRGLSTRSKLLLPLAWLLLGVFRVIILLIPLKRLAPLFGRDAGIDPWLPLVTSPQISRARDIRRAVALAVKYSPWSPNCYPQALTARVLLRLHRIPHVLFFGLARSANAGGLDAHAWLISGPVVVSGGPSFGRYTVVRMFAGGRAAGIMAK